MEDVMRANRIQQHSQTNPHIEQPKVAESIAAHPACRPWVGTHNASRPSPSRPDKPCHPRSGEAHGRVATNDDADFDRVLFKPTPPTKSAPFDRAPGNRYPRASHRS